MEIYSIALPQDIRYSNQGKYSNRIQWKSVIRQATNAQRNTVSLVIASW